MSAVPATVFEGGVLGEDRLDFLETLARGASESGDTGGGVTRRSRVEFLDLVAVNRWLYDVLQRVVLQANATHYQFDIWPDWREQLQLARYEAADEGCYDWHQDFGATAPASTRKLSLTVQLTDPGRYDGGELQIFKAGDSILSMPRARGTVVVFPAYQLHRVTPVTRGARHSCVAWYSGPAFR